MKTLTIEKLALILATSRTNANISQKQMANKLGKSVGTIKNWESGYATPNLIDTLDWFDVLGINPLAYMLEFLYPDEYHDKSTTEAIDISLNHYLSEVATSSEKRKLAYCIYGNTGSDWHSQVDMLTAHNHLDLRARVSVAATILNAYEMSADRNELINTDKVMPNTADLRNAIIQAKSAACNCKNGYINQD